MMNTTKPLIRYGWLRALTFLIVWLVLTVVLEIAGAALVKLLWGQAPVENGDNPQTIVKFIIACLGTTGLIVAWRRLVDHKDFESLGFEWKSFANDAWLGFFLAPALIGLGTIVLMLINFIQFTSLQIDAYNLVNQVLLMALIAYTEEIVVRGYLLNNLLQSFNKWIALAITAGFFAAMHLANPGVSLLSVANILLAGLLLGINYIYTRNLWFGILFHFAWNFFQGPVFGYEVSGISFSGLFQQVASGPVIWTGGAFGFEGSLLCILFIVVTIPILSAYFSKRYMPEQQSP